MEYDRRTTGINQEGLYAAAFSAVEKIANTIGPIIVGFALGLTGFISGQDGALPDQPPGVIFAIRMCVSVVPCCLAIMAASFMRFYDPNTVRADAGVTRSTE
jgi:GPH family glycoside/pentoside/hexuronide:cation symporter